LRLARTPIGILQNPGKLRAASRYSSMGFKCGRPRVFKELLRSERCRFGGGPVRSARGRIAQQFLGPDTGWGTERGGGRRRALPWQWSGIQRPGTWTLAGSCAQQFFCRARPSACLVLVAVSEAAPWQVVAAGPRPSRGNAAGAPAPRAGNSASSNTSRGGAVPAGQQAPSASMCLYDRQVASRKRGLDDFSAATGIAHSSEPVGRDHCHAAESPLSFADVGRGLPKVVRGVGRTSHIGLPELPKSRRQGAGNLIVEGLPGMGLELPWAAILHSNPP